ncbi:hypothetical protein BRAO375_2630001 [Bradyrhizobium sp. ORS 375]|nr:hypothetical protein BRAO375_2630001 [Bradyrhizobium sp. ORS 375]
MFDTTAMTAAHRTLPFGTRLRVTRLDTGRSVLVRINDRGPYVDGRVVDLSYAAASLLDMVDAGLADVRLDVVRWPKPRPRKLPLQQAAPANARLLLRPPPRLTLLDQTIRRRPAADSVYDRLAAAVVLNSSVGSDAR